MFPIAHRLPSLAECLAISLPGTRFCWRSAHFSSAQLGCKYIHVLPLPCLLHRCLVQVGSWPACLSTPSPCRPYRQLTISTLAGSSTTSTTSRAASCVPSLCCCAGRFPARLPGPHSCWHSCRLIHNLTRSLFLVCLHCVVQVGSLPAYQGSTLAGILATSAHGSGDRTVATAPMCSLCPAYCTAASCRLALCLPADVPHC
jgi:hypothetical protein